MKTKTKREAVLVVLLLGAPVAAAAAPDCANPQDQATMNACAARAYAKSDADLNRTYKTLIARLKNDADAARRLTAAQHAWIAFRDAECAFASAGSAGGSANAMVRAGCLDKQTRARTAALNGYLHCEEGDLSCPAPPAD